MIPEAAVEAAWEAFYEGKGGMRKALEAAAPHMAAEAWESAYGLGYADRNVNAAPTRTNPYRSQA